MSAIQHKNVTSVLRRAAAAMLAVVAGLAAGSAAHAQEWPSRFIKFYVAGSPGSAPDVIARIIGNDLSQILGQQIVIENKPGAGGNLGTEAAARATPDGYSFLFGQAAPLALNQYTFKNVPFNVEKDFDPVIMVGTSPMMIAASPKAEFRTLPELVAKAKAQPGKISFGTSSVKNIPHSTGELLKIKAGIDIVHVSYRSNAQVVGDTISGTVPLMIDGLPVVMPQVKNGALIPLAVSSLKRLPSLDNIPAVAETYPGFDVEGWFAILAPHGTPQVAIDKMNQAAKTVLQKPAILERMRDLGVYWDSDNTTPAQLREYIRSQSKLYGEIARAAKMEAE